MAEHDDSLVLELARFAVASRRDGIPESVLSDLTNRVLDVIGNSIGALGDEAARATLGLVRSWSGTPEAPIIGDPSTRVPAAHAALVNGTLAHSLDYDDTHLPSILHPSASVVPATLALSSSLGTGGEEALKAAAIGDEICVRLGMAAYDPSIGNSIFFENGFHATSICGTVASAASAATLMGLDESGIGHAMAIAASMGAGLLEANRTGGSVKRMHCGWAAHAGISAATLAREGLTGPPTVLEGRFGFFRAYSEGRFDVDELVGDLGERWEILRTHFKPYPANHFTHPGIDGAVALRRRGVVPSDIRSIELGVAAPTLRTIAEPADVKAHPATPHAAKFSGPFTVAAALHGGGGLGVSHSDFSLERLRDPAILETAASVSCVADEQATLQFPNAFLAVIRATLHDGSLVEERIRANRGGPDMPLSEAELYQKFSTNVQAHLDQHATERLATAIWDLRQLESVDDLIALTAGTLA